MEKTDPLKQHSFAIPGYLNQLGLTPTVSSQTLGWDNLLAAALPYTQNLPPLRLPAIPEEDQILVQLSQPVQLRVKIGKEHFSVLGMPATSSTIPNHFPATWDISGPVQLFLISLKHRLLTQVALEVLDIDPEHVNLAGTVGEKDPFIYQVSQMILGEIYAQALAGSLFIESLTQSLVIHLIREYVVFPKEFPRVKGKLSPRVLRSVLNFIDEYLDEDLTLEKIAAVANLSTFHFSRLFKQTVNVPVHHYVLQKRLEYGKDLLTKGKLTITEVAARAGFADASHFNRHFKRRFGIAPKVMLK